LPKFYQDTPVNADFDFLSLRCLASLRVEVINILIPTAEVPVSAEILQRLGLFAIHPKPRSLTLPQKDNIKLP
jgi:hypothetical protein